MGSNKKERLNLALTNMQQNYAEGMKAGRREMTVIGWVRARMNDGTLTEEHVDDLLLQLDRAFQR